jgi:hypothetical protein
VITTITAEGAEAAENGLLGHDDDHRRDRKARKERIFGTTTITPEGAKAAEDGRRLAQRVPRLQRRTRYATHANTSDLPAAENATLRRPASG